MLTAFGRSGVCRAPARRRGHRRRNGFEQYVRRERLLEGAWGPDTYASDRIVDNHIANLRKKIEPDPAQPRYLRNLRGLGYRFDG
jgi:DNA-binding response OmpR family regulator